MFALISDCEWTVLCVSEDRWYHGHAATVSGGSSDSGLTNIKRGHGASLPAHVRHHRQDQRRRDTGGTSFSQAIHGRGIFHLYSLLYTYALLTNMP